jgi:isoamylase
LLEPNPAYQGLSLSTLGTYAVQLSANLDSNGRLTALRHRFPILRRNRFLTGSYDKELDVRDLIWINANGKPMEDIQWHDEQMRCFGMLMDGRAQETGIRQRGRNVTMLLVVNGYHDAVEFTLPECPGAYRWNRLSDTNILIEEAGGFDMGSAYMVTSRSLLLFALERDGKR